jgi:hypothetical protein
MTVAAKKTKKTPDELLREAVRRSPLRRLSVSLEIAIEDVEMAIAKNSKDDDLIESLKMAKADVQLALKLVVLSAAARSMDCMCELDNNLAKNKYRLRRGGH